MASKLDSINVSPVYQVKIPSTGEVVNYRPYQVKEERALLAADQTEDGIVMLNTLLSVVKNCLTPTPKKLTSFDLEYLFAQIRAKSVGEIANIRVGCDADGCEEVAIEYRYDLQNIQVVFPEGKDTAIKLSDTLAVKMSYPSVEEAIQIEREENNETKKYLAIKSSIELIYSEDEVIDVSQESQQSLTNFVDRLLPSHYKKLEDFLESVPEVEGTLKYRCTNCRKEHNKTIKGLASFFS